MNQILITKGGLYVKEITSSGNSDKPGMEEQIDSLITSYKNQMPDFSNYIDLVEQFSKVFCYSFSSVKDFITVQSNNPYLTAVGWTFLVRLINYSAMLNDKKLTGMFQEQNDVLYNKLNSYCNFNSFRQDGSELKMNKEELNRRLKDLDELDERVFKNHLCNNITNDFISSLYSDIRLVNNIVKLLFV